MRSGVSRARARRGVIEKASLKGAGGAQSAPDGRDSPGSVIPERSLRLALAVVGIVVVVMIAAGGTQVLLPAAGLSGAGKLAVRIGGGVLVAVGMALLVVERRRIKSLGIRGPDPSVVSVRAAATIMGIVAFLALANLPPAQPGDGGETPTFTAGGSPFGSDAPGAGEQEARTRGGDPVVRGSDIEIPVELFPIEFVDAPAPGVVQRAIGFLPQIILFFLVMMVVRRIMRRQEGHEPLEFVVDPARARAGLEESLVEVTDYGSDPRGQITNAYHRLLSALAAAGVPREPPEAPHEHLHRALGPLGVRPEPLHRLAELYVLAQFSGHPVTEQHRVGAVHSLEASLGDLRKHATSSANDGAGLAFAESHA
jgi:uncharacterized protein DUF4129